MTRFIQHDHACRCCEMAWWIGNWSLIESQRSAVRRATEYVGGRSGGLKQLTVQLDSLSEDVRQKAGGRVGRVGRDRRDIDWVG